jgi:hypothetical protein
MPLIVVSGPLANKPGNGGAAWTRLGWALGLRQLECDVYFVEQISSANCVDADGSRCDPAHSVNLAYFTEVTQQFGLGDRSALVLESGSWCAGLNSSELLDLAQDADLLINISGHLTIDRLKSRFRKRAFLDLDPGYTQYWYASGLGVEHIRDHHFYFTVGENIGRDDCQIPVSDISWRPIRQPVLLRSWPVVDVEDGPLRFTTVASWRGPYGPISHNGVQLGPKAHEFRKFLTLPTQSDHEFEIALDIHPADRRDLEAMRAQGWHIADPAAVAGNPSAFRQYLQQSGAEFSVAQGIYVNTNCGWFSDRTVRYLASGKPALVQDTGFSRIYPVGCGLVPFRTLADAVNGADRVDRDYAAHSRAARAIAEQFFDSDTVLTTLLQDVEVAA